MAIGAVLGVELAQIHLRHRLDHEPRKVVLGQPLAQRRRQQKRLLTITRDEVLGHTPNRLHRAGRTQGLCDSLVDERASRLGRRDACLGRGRAE